MFTEAELDVLADKISYRMAAAQKGMWSAAEIAERWHVKPDFVRKRMAAGDFGELYQINSRTRLVPYAGLIAYEQARLKAPERKAAAPRPKRRAKHYEPVPL